MRSCFPVSVFCLLGAALLLPGCLISSSEHSHYEGKHVSQSTLEQIRPGASQEDVVGLIGEPTEKATRKDGAQVWTWSYREVTEKSGAVFLLFSSESKKESTGSVAVVFRDGKVERTYSSGSLLQYKPRPS